MRRLTGLSGLLAALLFTGSLLGFAAVRHDDYSHATKAVSELGAVGAPHAMAFNLLGFILPGALIVIMAFGYGRVLGRVFGPLMLGLSGLSLAAAGLFPADMDHLSSTTLMLHFIAAQSSGLSFAIAVFPLGAAMRATPGLKILGAWTPAFILFLVVNIGWQIAWRTTGLVLPGWGQRIGFGGYMLWIALAGLALTRLSDRAQSGESG